PIARLRNTRRTLCWRKLQYRANDERRRNESQKGQVPAAGFVVSFGDGMNRTPIASPLLLVGRDATETWHGSDDEYREVGFSPAIGWSLLARLAILMWHGNWYYFQVARIPGPGPHLLMGRWRRSNVGAEFRNAGRRSVGLRICAVVRLPERRQVPAEVQFEVARNAVTDIADLGAAPLCTGQGQQWEEQVVARLKLSSCRRPEPIDLGLRRGQRFAVERGQTPGERIDKRVEVAIVQRAVHPAIALGDISIEIVAAEDDLKCARAADQAREPFQRSAARDQSDADLGVAE